MFNALKKKLLASNLLINYYYKFRVVMINDEVDGWNDIKTTFNEKFSHKISYQ